MSLTPSQFPDLLGSLSPQNGGCWETSCRGPGPTAVLEMSQAAGRALLPRPCTGRCGPGEHGGRRTPHPGRLVLRSSKGDRRMRRLCNNRRRLGSGGSTRLPRRPQWSRGGRRLRRDDALRPSRRRIRAAERGDARRDRRADRTTGLADRSLPATLRSRRVESRGRRRGGWTCGRLGGTRCPASTRFRSRLRIHKPACRDRAGHPGGHRRGIPRCRFIPGKGPRRRTFPCLRPLPSALHCRKRRRRTCQVRLRMVWRLSV